MTMGRPTKKKVLPSTVREPGTWLIHKPYADPVHAKRHADLKRILLGDMVRLADFLKFHGNDADRLVFEHLQSEVGKLIEAGEGEVDLPYDTYSSLRYRVSVEKVK